MHTQDHSCSGPPVKVNVNECDLVPLCWYKYWRFMMEVGNHLPGVCCIDCIDLCVDTSSVNTQIYTTENVTVSQLNVK